MSNQYSISREKIVDVMVYWIVHPSYSYKKIAKLVDLSPKTVRHIVKATYYKTINECPFLEKSKNEKEVIQNKG